MNASGRVTVTGTGGVNGAPAEAAVAADVDGACAAAAKSVSAMMSGEHASRPSASPLTLITAPPLLWTLAVLPMVAVALHDKYPMMDFSALGVRRTPS